MEALKSTGFEDPSGRIGESTVQYSTEIDWEELATRKTRTPVVVAMLMIVLPKDAKAAAVDVQKNAMVSFRRTMMRRLLILAFVLSVLGDSLAAVAPHMDGEGCAAACCKAARQNRPDANMSKLRCLVDCNQPGGTSSPSPVASIVGERHAKPDGGLIAFRVDAAPSLRSITFRSKNNLTTGSIDVYLRTGTLLI